MEAISSLAMDNQQPRDMGETKKRGRPLGLKPSTIGTWSLKQQHLYKRPVGVYVMVFFLVVLGNILDQVSKAAHCLQEQLNVFDLCTFKK